MSPCSLDVGNPRSLPGGLCLTPWHSAAHLSPAQQLLVIDKLKEHWAPNITQKVPRQQFIDCVSSVRILYHKWAEYL